MVWLNPAALAGLIAVAGPLLVHLLRRRQAGRIVVPTVRFVALVDRSAVRPRPPSDLALLVLRAIIVALAAFALAQPLLRTESRTRAWAERLARVVIVDTSESVSAANAREALVTQLSSADPATTIETGDIGSALGRAKAWLAQSPPARREIVVLSDFQRGALTESDLSGIPLEIGVRLIPVTDATTISRAAPLVQVFDGNRKLTGRVRLEGERTVVTWSAETTATDGLQIVAPPADAGAVAGLVRVVSAAGAHLPSASQPILIRFPGGRLPAASVRSTADWTRGAGERLLASPEIAGLGIKASTHGGSLLVDVDANPRSLAAAQAVKSTLDARIDPQVFAEHEVERIPAASLAAWSREAGPPDATAWQRSNDSDGRWLWATALLLLGVETFVRRSAVTQIATIETHAA